jgi:peptidoglycan/LPS O-acetylase OafA/YrhL
MRLPMRPPGERLPTVDVLRGLAALAVSWYHFTTANPTLPGPGLLRASGEYGWMGVEVFFVISGFIIPFALDRGGYVVRDYGRFLLKRIIRLDPPYLASIAIILIGKGLALRVPALLGTSSPIDPIGVLLHLGYLNAFFHYPWLNVVFWTLAVEFQFYLIAGLVYPVVARGTATSRAMLFLAAGAGAYLVDFEGTACHWLMVFFAGALVYQHRAGQLRAPALCAWLAGAGAVTIVTHGPLVAALVTAAALTIAFVQVRPAAPLLWLGSISYSLYLMHPIVGGRIMNWASRHATGEAAAMAFVALSVAASLAVSWLLYRLVERPAQRWSSRLRYRGAAVMPENRAITAS